MLEPYDEEIALKIMEIYEENGKRSSAILFYKEFQKKLMISLGIQPSRELKQKYFSLKNMGESKNSSQSGINIQEKKRGYGRGNKVYLELSTTCISKLKYYWITSFLESLEDKIDFDFYISEIEKRDLGFIFSPFQKEGFSEQIPDVRIASAFLHLLGKLKIDYSIHVHIENYEDMDFFSSSLIKIVNQRKLLHILL
nr:BTAD domain-containing putative transcriptional regulator [Fusobacterium necrophorum]